MMILHLICRKIEVRGKEPTGYIHFYPTANKNRRIFYYKAEKNLLSRKKHENKSQGCQRSTGKIYNQMNEPPTGQNRYFVGFKQGKTQFDEMTDLLVS